MPKPYRAQGSPAAEDGRGWGLRSLVRSWAFPEYWGPRSPKSSCPTFVILPAFASSHLPPPPSAFTHPHVCTHTHMLPAPRVHRQQGFHMHSHTGKSGKSVLP